MLLAPRFALGLYLSLAIVEFSSSGPSEPGLKGQAGDPRSNADELPVRRSRGSWALDHGYLRRG
jgi:hypothetical protein